MTKTKQTALFLATPGGRTAKQIDAYIEAREVVAERRRAFQDKYGTPGATFYRDDTLVYVNAEKSPEPKHAWSRHLEYGYYPNGRASGDLLREKDALRLPRASAFMDALDVPPEILEGFSTGERAPGGGVYYVTSPVSFWAHKGPCGVYLVWAGEPGDDPPWCPPDCTRISEIEYGKIVKASEEKQGE